jgi:hypothetical protein
MEYALKMEDIGIDALELNFYNNNMDFGSAAAIEEKQLKTLQLCVRVLSCPYLLNLVLSIQTL